ncbi:MAG: hypothetical protein WKF88_12545 [Ferruginibacter sp.]
MEYEKEERNRLHDRDKVTIRVRSISNYVMGMLLIAAGFFFLFPVKSTARYIDQYDPSMIKVFGIVCWIYGLFRIYRGYKKNYFRES